MSIHDEARAASEAVYDHAIDSLTEELLVSRGETDDLRGELAAAESELSAATTALESLHSKVGVLTGLLSAANSTVETLKITVERLNARITELEAGEEPEVPKGWTPIYDSVFTADEGWEKRQETQSNDNSYNTPKNVVFGNKDGLYLLGKRETLGGRPYTSADILGRHIRVPNYFRAEVTATMPTDYGMWPCALWFRPLTGGDSGEIDVMETWPFDWNGTPRLYSTVWENYTTKRKENARLDYSKLPNPDPAAPHTYVVEKVKDRITFSVDGVIVYSWEKATMNATMKSWYDSVYEIPGREWYPRITLQIGGPNAKEPKPEWRESKMVIHRLRIFKEA